MRIIHRFTFLLSTAVLLAGAGFAAAEAPEADSQPVFHRHVERQGIAVDLEIEPVEPAAGTSPKA